MKKKFIQINNNIVEGLFVLCVIYEFGKTSQLYLNTYWIGIFLACFMLGIYFNNK